MKKDIDWLKEKVQAMIDQEYRCYDPLIQQRKHTCRLIMDLIEQIDEPETLNEEWINEHSKSYTMENAVEISDLKNLLLPQPKKPVIPQFVAEYIEQSKKDNDSINQVFAFMDDKEDKNLWHWLFPSMYEEKRANQEIFMRAWLDGYEVEKEKRYFIKEPVTGQFLIRDGSQSRGVKWLDGFSTSPSYFAETEIKAIDERYWVFAEEVTE